MGIPSAGPPEPAMGVRLCELTQRFLNGTDELRLLLNSLSESVFGNDSKLNSGWQQPPADGDESVKAQPSAGPMSISGSTVVDKLNFSNGRLSEELERLRYMITSYTG